MCRIPKVLLIAPTDKQSDLRRALSSLEYEIVAAITTPEEAADMSADVAVVWEPDADAVSVLRQRGLKTVAISVEDTGADMHVSPDDVSRFKSRIWELFAPD